MMNLVPLEEGALRAFLAVVEVKKGLQKPRLLALSGRVKRLFWAYREHRHDLAGLPRSLVYTGDQAWRLRMWHSHAYRHAARTALQPGSSFSEDAHKALLHCYEETDARDALLTTIRERQPDRARWACQYCCGAGRSHTWDHYIGKGQCPEFSVYPPNLIPACAECNTLKGVVWMKHGKRTCIHFYYDRISPRLRLIDATIDIDARGDPEVSFFLARGRVRLTRFGRLLALHWGMFQLERRLREAALTKLSSIAADVKMLASLMRLDADDVRQSLVSKASDLARSYGENHFETVLYRAAAASRPLIEYYLRQVRA